MSIRITTLSENTASYGFLAEWGLSILIEADDTNLLLDTGLSFSAARNAQTLGIDLSTIDQIVLSHGHADHTGGLPEMLALMEGVEVIAHPEVFAAKCVRTGADIRDVGTPFHREEMASLGAWFNLTREPETVAAGIMTTGEIPLTTEYETVDDNLLVRQNSNTIPDPLLDDLALVIDADFGLVVILGCAHRGIVNTLRHAMSLSGRDSVHTVIGGTHLLGASNERIERTIADLKTMEIQKLGVSHCTGFAASARLAQESGGVFFLNNAGTRFTLP